MPTTTLATTPTTNEPPRRWEPPEKVVTVLDRIASVPDGHVTLSLFDREGREFVRTKDSATEVDRPIAWLRAEVETVVWWNSEDYPHLRLRVWARGGVPVAGVKFALPSKEEVGPEPPKFIPTSRSAPRTGSASLATPAAPVAPRLAVVPRTATAPSARAMPPTRSPIGTASPDHPATRTRSGSSFAAVPVAAHNEGPSAAEERGRADGLDRQVHELCMRLDASEQRSDRLAEALAEAIAERDAARADVAMLVDQLHELADTLEAS